MVRTYPTKHTSRSDWAVCPLLCAIVSCLLCYEYKYFLLSRQRVFDDSIWRQVLCLNTNNCIFLSSSWNDILSVCAETKDSQLPIDSTKIIARQYICLQNLLINNFFFNFKTIWKRFQFYLNRKIIKIIRNKNELILIFL